MKNLLVILFFISTTIYPQLEITLRTDKETYEYGEKIELYCKITNPADTTFKFLAGSYQTCQAQFSFNDFKSWDHTDCLTLSEWLTFKPHSSKIYEWIIDPEQTGLPNKDGLQQIVGYYYFDLTDTIYINAPQILGGKLEVSFLDSVASQIQKIKDSLNIVVLKSSRVINRYTETWQIVDYRIDSLIQNFNQDSLFTYAEQYILLTYESIIDENPVDYYPLQIGNKWYYEVNKIWGWNAGELNYLLTKEVMKDTTFANNVEYKKVRESRSDTNLIRYYFERVDSNTATVIRVDPFFVNNDEFLVYNLVSNTDTSIYIWNFYGGSYSEGAIFLKDENVKDIFEDQSLSRNTKFFSTGETGSTGLEYSLSKGIGNISQNCYIIDGFDYNRKLKASLINGEIYGDATLVSIEENNHEIPSTLLFAQNYPNPFNPTTTIEYTIPNVAEGYSLNNVQLRVYDILGKELATLVNENQKAGNYETIFDASNLASGIYYYQLQVGDFIETKKMILLK